MDWNGEKTGSNQNEKLLKRTKDVILDGKKSHIKDTNIFLAG